MNKEGLEDSEYVTRLLQRPEDKWLDFKRAEIKPRDLAPLISAFANSDGGTIVIGVDDKSRAMRGICAIGHEALNNLLETPIKQCCPAPACHEQFIDITNEKGEPDRLLLLVVEKSDGPLIRTRDGATYLRVGDRTLEVKGEDLRNLEYRRGVRSFEAEACALATLEDLDEEAIALFKRSQNAEKLSTEQVLRSRGLMVKKQGEWVPTNAAVLLFAKEVSAFYPNCRVRFVRYQGEHQGVGTSYNVVKDVSFDACLLKLLPQVREFIKSQLRDFTTLDAEKGVFVTVPEYPDFAWLEGITNAITHREYALSGDHILVSMYDDRLVIASPGGLPGPVTVDNMRVMRYSRNSRIARVLAECGWVRELNEGVKRIYAEMEGFFLDAPEYSDANSRVALTLRNNVMVRQGRRLDQAKRLFSSLDWGKFDDLERQILVFLVSHNKALVRDIVSSVGRSKPTVVSRLKKLQSKGILRLNASSPRDPYQSYELAYEE